MENTKNEGQQVLQLREVSPETTGAFAELERGVHAALETYSNVHRGSGHHSMVSTYLFEEARDIVLGYLGLNKGRYVVVFCTPRRAMALTVQLKPGSYQMVSSQALGLSIGVNALAIKRKALPKGTPFQSGGGTAKLISPGWVIWAGAPDKFEAGTPAIVNVIAFARALRLIRKYGDGVFFDRDGVSLNRDAISINSPVEKLTAAEILYHDDLENHSGRELLTALKQTLIGRGVSVPTKEGVKSYINLDNSASTPTFRPVWNAFRQTLQQSLQVQRAVIDEVKSICAKVLGATETNYEVLFTSNTTEAINLAAESLGRELEEGIEPVVLNTMLEHSSNDLPWRMIPGHSLTRLSVDEDGFIDLKELDALLSAYNREGQHGKKRIKLVAMSGASNVLGTCNDMAEISRIVHRHDALLLVDAAQLVAHRKVDMEAWGIDYLAFSAHKVYAPFGSGALVARKGLLNFSAGELEQIQSSGEENAGGIAALGKAFVLLQRIGMDVIEEEERALTVKALHGLSQVPGLRIYGVQGPESPKFDQKIGVIVFNLREMMADKVGNKLAGQCGIGVRTGCHCAHILVKHILHVGPSLQRFQWVLQTVFPKINFPGVVRVSLGIENSEEEIDTLVQGLNRIAGKSQSQNSMPTLSKAKMKQQMNDFSAASTTKVYSL